MGFFLTDAIQSALTPPGTAAAQGDTKSKKYPQTLAGSTLHTLSPLIGQQAAFAGNLEPFRQQGIWDLIHAASPGGMLATSEQARRNYMGNATASLPFLHARLNEGGAGIGAIQGADAGAISGATSKANDLFGWLASPEGQQALAQMRMQATQFSLPALGPFAQLASIIYGRPAPQVGASPLSSIASIAPFFMGGGNPAALAGMAAGGGGAGVGSLMGGGLGTPISNYGGGVGVGTGLGYGG